MTISATEHKAYGSLLHKLRSQLATAKPYTHQLKELLRVVDSLRSDLEEVMFESGVSQDNTVYYPGTPLPKTVVRAYNIVQFLEKCEHDLQQRLAIKKWGRWQYEEGTDHESGEAYRVLNLIDNGTAYQIDLATAKTPIERHNWLWHLWEKEWITGDDIRNLMQAFADLFNDGSSDHIFR
jgi:hypothetical protein